MRRYSVELTVIENGKTLCNIVEFICCKPDQLRELILEHFEEWYQKDTLYRGFKIVKEY